MEYYILFLDIIIGVRKPAFQGMPAIISDPILTKRIGTFDKQLNKHNIHFLFDIVRYINPN
jgi:hypothetical protein